MEKIQVNIKDVLSTVSQNAIDALSGEANDGLRKIQDGSGLGNDFLGWVKLPTDTTEALLDDIVATAASLRRDCDVVVCIGIGPRQLVRSDRKRQSRSALRRPEHRRGLSL